MQKPSGYPKEIFRELNPKFVCAYCRLVLKNPMQSICGHRFCNDCIDYIICHENSRICPSCTAEGGDFEDFCLTVEQTFPDDAIKRECNSMKAACVFEGCSWSGSFKDYETHYMTCEHRELECKGGTNYPISRQRQLLENECTFREVNCPSCNDSVLLKDLVDHYMNCRPTLRSGQRMLCNSTFPSAESQLDALDKKVKSLEKTLAMKDVKISELHLRTRALEQTLSEYRAESRENDNSRTSDDNLAGLLKKICDLELVIGMTGGPSSPGQESLIGRISRLENQTRSMSPGQQQQYIRATASQAEARGIPANAHPATQLSAQSRLEAIQETIAALGMRAEMLTQEVDSMERQRRQISEQLGAMAGRIRSLERAVALRNANIVDLSLRITDLEQASYDGTLLWRIDDFARRRQEAISGRTTSIYSPVFYTNKTGYKMCV